MRRHGCSRDPGPRGHAGLERFDTLSMGMTADLEAAIQAGSTMVRVGTGASSVRATYPAGSGKPPVLS
jgi:hypothetical protein